MADQFNSGFEHEVLEADIKSLAQEIRRHREMAESEKPGEKELLKMAIRSLPQLPARAGKQQSAAPAKKSSPLPGYARDAPADIRLEIEYLLDLAFHAGIGKAEAESRKSPAFVQDAFHDALAGVLYPELEKRGILK